MTEQKVKVQTCYQPCLDFSSAHFNQHLLKEGTRQKAYVTAGPKLKLIVAGKLFKPEPNVRYQVIVRHKKSGVCRMMRYCQSNSPDKIMESIKKRFSKSLDFNKSEISSATGRTLPERVYHFTERDPISYFDLNKPDGVGWEFVDVRPVDEHGSNAEVKIFNSSFMARFILDKWVNPPRREMSRYSGIRLDIEHPQGYVALDTVYEMSSLIPS